MREDRREKWAAVAEESTKVREGKWEDEKMERKKRPLRLRFK